MGESLTGAVARAAAVLTEVAIPTAAVVAVPIVAVEVDSTAEADISAGRVLAGGCQPRQSKEVAAPLEVPADLALVLRAMAVSSGIVEPARIGPPALHQL